MEQGWLRMIPLYFEGPTLEWYEISPLLSKLIGQSWLRPCALNSERGKLVDFVKCSLPGLPVETVPETTTEVLLCCPPSHPPLPSLCSPAVAVPTIIDALNCSGDSEQLPVISTPFLYAIAAPFFSEAAWFSPLLVGCHWALFFLPEPPSEIIIQPGEEVNFSSWNLELLFGLSYWRNPNFCSAIAVAVAGWPHLGQVLILHLLLNLGDRKSVV